MSTPIYASCISETFAGPSLKHGAIKKSGVDRGISLIKVLDDLLHMVDLCRAIDHHAAFLGGSFDQFL